MRAAILGLGLIGTEWAKNLKHDNALTAAWNRTPKSGFDCMVDTIEEVPSRAEILHVVVSDERATLDVIQRFCPKLTKAHAVVQSTTIDPATSNTLKALVERTGASYLEAPFTGSLPAAKERKTVFFMGADTGTAERLLPYLRHLSQHQFHIGTNAQACMIKLAMNLQIAGVMAALAESLSICRAAGISDDTFFAAYKQNAAYSGVGSLKEPKLRTEDFSPQFSVKHMAKDMRLLAATVSTDSRMLEAVRKLLVATEEAGLGEQDFSAMIKLMKD